MPEWLDIAVRSALFVALYFHYKMVREKQISELTFFEYVTGISIGNIGAEVAIDLNGTFFTELLELSFCGYSLFRWFNFIKK